MKRIHTLVFGAGVLAALGFGSASAFAKPAAKHVWEYCPSQPDEFSCSACCKGMQSNVYDFDGGTGQCLCWI